MTRRSLVAAIGLVIALAGLAVSIAAPRGSTAAPAFDGRALFVGKGCASCHTGPDPSSPTGAGPPLVDAAAWAGTRRPGTDAASYLAESMRAPGVFISPALVGDAMMPQLVLTDDEIDRLVSYLLER